MEVRGSWFEVTHLLVQLRIWIEVYGILPCLAGCEGSMD